MALIWSRNVVCGANTIFQNPTRRYFSRLDAQERWLHFNPTHVGFLPKIPFPTAAKLLKMGVLIASYRVRCLIQKKIDLN